MDLSNFNERQEKLDWIGVIEKLGVNLFAWPPFVSAFAERALSEAALSGLN